MGVGRESGGYGGLKEGVEGISVRGRCVEWRGKNTRLGREGREGGEMCEGELGGETCERGFRGVLSRLSP